MKLVVKTTALVGGASVCGAFPNHPRCMAETPRVTDKLIGKLAGSLTCKAPQSISMRTPPLANSDPQNTPHLDVLPTTQNLQIKNLRVDSSPTNISCPLLLHPSAHKDNTPGNHDEAYADRMAQLNHLKTGLTALMAQKDLPGTIEWRLKSADSTLGKLILRAIQSDVEKPLKIRDAQHACQLIADNHEKLHNFVRQLCGLEDTHPALLDQVGLRIILAPPRTAADCLDLASTLKHTLEQPSRGNTNGLCSFSLNPKVCEKDYISNPKNNGYQSFHLSLITSADEKLNPQSQQADRPLPIELQIRTVQMHQHAACGDAKHNTYKENQRLLLNAFKAFYGILGTSTKTSPTNDDLPDHDRMSVEDYKSAAQQGCAL